MFTNTYLPHVGGVASSVHSFAEDLRDKGHSVLIVAPTFPGSDRHDRTEPKIFRVPAIQEFNGSDFSVRIPSPFLLDEQIDDFEPDIVHSHHPYLLGDAALRVARRRSLPLIFTHHTLYEAYTHYISGEPRNMKRFAAFLSTHYANLCDRVIAPSRSIMHLIRKRGVSVPVAEIPTGVDVSFFSNGDGDAFRRKHGIPKESFAIGHLGRLAPEKNITFLARAVARTMANHPETHFIAVGEGPSRETIENIMAESDLQDRLIMPGTITGRPLADAYHAMDLFSFSSKTETQGMVLTEAMAAGVPVVALNAPGAREVVRDGLNGYLVDAEATEEQFARTLTRAASAPGKLADMAKHARRTAEAMERRVSAEKMAALYTEVLSDAGNRHPMDSDTKADLDLWDKFLLACRAEWDLIAGKTESVIQAMDEKQRVVGIDETD